MPLGRFTLLTAIGSGDLELGADRGRLALGDSWAEVGDVAGGASTVVLITAGVALPG
jgi:hypothetical protein